MTEFTIEILQFLIIILLTLQRCTLQIVFLTDRGKAQGKKRRSSSSSSSSSSTASSSSDSSSEDTPERSRRINSPIRVSPERREYKVNLCLFVCIYVCTIGQLTFDDTKFEKFSEP